MTWVPVVAGSLPERDAVLGQKPESYERLREFLALTWEITDPQLLELCRLRLAQIMGARAELAGVDARLLEDLQSWDESPRFSERERAALSFVEQYHYDHNRLSDEQKSDLARHLSERETFNFIWAVHMNDAYLRVLTLLDIAPDPSSTPPRPERGQIRAGLSPRIARDDAEEAGSSLMRSQAGPEFDDAHTAFSMEVRRQTLINDVTSEAIRLRNARYQGCEFCMSIRRAVEEPPEGDLLEEAVSFERSTFFNEPQKVAFRMHGAFLAHPAGLSDEDRADVVEHFSPEAIAELVLKFIYWSTNRAFVLTGMDAGAANEGRLTSFHFDEEGRFFLHTAGI